MTFRARQLLSTTCLTAAFLYAGGPARANPTGGTVSAGSSTISISGQTLTVTQNTAKTVIDWRGFDIGADEITTFVQPSKNSIALNRVNSDHASDIEGQLSANGNIIIVNQNGILFGPHSQIDVNGLIATTADISNRNFMKGKLTFNKAGNPDAAIINTGQITAGEAGLVGFVAPNVINSGIITAHLGRVQLASGDTATVDFYGDKLMEVAVSDNVKSQLVSNSGVLRADGGTVAMTAAAGSKIVNSLISNTGALQAQSVGMKGGKIVIAAAGVNAVDGNVAANKGKKQGASTVLVGGTLDAGGYATGQTGGAITITADNVGIMSGALIGASGDAGGGAIKIGGDFHGAGTTATALNTYIDQNAYIFADAINSGNGGTVAVWSDGTTNFAGNIFARGGTNSGNGGYVETSGHDQLNATGYVDLTATNGDKGSYLLDPTDITIYGNFAPDYGTVVQGDSTTLASSLKLWLDASDTSNVILTYNGTGTTASGTSGANTITVGSAVGLTVGARIQLGGTGADSYAASVNNGTDNVYTVQSISGTTITLASNLTSTYIGAAVNEGYVSQLTDKSGNANNATQNTFGNMPLWISNGQNGLGAASFNGSNSWLSLPSVNFASGQSFTLGAQVLLSPGAGQYPMIFSNAGGGTNLLFGAAIGSSSDYGFNIYMNGIQTSNTISPSTNVAYNVMTTYNGVTPQAYVNGKAQGGGNSGTISGYSNGSDIGNGAPGGNSYWNGLINELYLYNTALSTNAQALVNQYQAAKWAVTLASPGVIGSEAGLTGAEAQAAMASTQAGATTDGYSVFTTSYLNRLSQTSNIILDASHNINLDLQGDTLNLASGRSLTLTAGNQITTASAGTVTTNNGSINLNATNGINLNHAITFNSNGGAINFNNAVTMGAATAVNSGNGTVTFASTVDGAHNLTVNSGTGTTTFGGKIGSVTPLANLSITADNVSFTDKIYGTGTLTIKPSTLSAQVNLNDGLSTGLYLTGAELGYIQNDWAGLVFGSTSDTANLTLAANNWVNPIIFNTGGMITVSGAQNSTGDMVLNAATDYLNAVIALSSGTLSGTAATVNVGASGTVQNGVDAVASGGTVNLAAATYDLASEITIGKSLTLNGDSMAGTVLNGQNAARVMEIDGTAGGITDTLNYLTVENGNGAGTNQSGTYGGGLLLYNEFGNQSTVTINDSTFTGNSTVFGGAIMTDGENSGFTTLTINDSTISGNSASFYGGGIYNDGETRNAVLTINNSTIANNTAVDAGGIENDGTGGGTATLRLNNTILAANTASGSESDYNSDDGTFISLGHNLYGQSGDAGGFIGSGTTDILLGSTINAVLHPLANNGGPGKTMALITGSAAIDAGNGAASGTADERGILRGSSGTGTGVDIGAYELATIDVSADNQEIVYGQSLPALTYTVTNGPSGKVSGAVALTAAESNAGTYNGDIGLGTVALTDNRYVLDFTAGNLLIDQRHVTIDPTAGQNKIYGAADPTLTYTTAAATGTTGLIGGDTLSGLLSYAGAGQYANAGSYAYNSGTLSAGSNYILAIAGGAPAFTVNKRGVTATLADKDLKYGVALNALDASNPQDVTFNGLVGTDTAAGLDNITFTYGGATPGIANRTGSYVLGIGSLTDNNYNLSVFAPGMLTIDAQPVPAMSILPSTVVHFDTISLNQNIGSSFILFSNSSIITPLNITIGSDNFYTSNAPNISGQNNSQDNSSDKNNGLKNIDPHADNDTRANNNQALLTIDEKLIKEFGLR